MGFEHEILNKLHESRVLSEANARSEEERLKMITNPAEKKVFIAVSDAMAEYGGQITGDRREDAEIAKHYNNYVKTGNVKSLKHVAAAMCDVTGSPAYRTNNF